MEAVWRIEMLGTLRATRDDLVVTRFRTRRVTLLLAYLAFYRHRLHSREEIGEMLWPETDPEVVRRNLRQALSSLRHVLEPPPLPSGSILQVEQARLRLNPDLVVADVAQFETLIDEARRKRATPEEIASLEAAIEMYHGEFLPGLYEDWILQERMRLDDLYLGAIRRLVEHNRAFDRNEETIRLLHLALDRDRLNEEWHVALMRESLAADRPASAIEQFAVLKEQLRKHLVCDPSEVAYALRNEARRALRGRPHAVPAPDHGRIPTEPSRSSPLGEADVPPSVVRLPVQITRFCGRDEEIARTLEHLDQRDARLTTLHGPAGTGKTRLSIEVGRRLAERSEGNVWFVPLADLASAASIPDAILDTLRARRSGHRDAIENLAAAVPTEGRHVLILDNLEHIMDEAVPIVRDLLERVPQLRLLVTSRRLLNLESEHQIPVPPLPVPTGSAGRDPLDREELLALAEFPSLQLFVDRCQTVRPDFGLTIHNARAVAAICVRLEGIPLAIELAAGLSGSFTPGQMIYHLDKRLTALTSRKRDTPARHRSLGAAVAYSYDTLTPELQRLFAALSVFRGGFTVEAAREVCLSVGFAEDGPATSFGASLELVLQLQERSLLRAQVDEDATEASDGESRELRFWMLESFREAGEEHLSESELFAFRARHAAFYRTHPTMPTHSLSAAELTERRLWIESEFDNYVAAIEFSLGQGEDEACVGLLSTLQSTWSSRGPRLIERSLIRRLAERVEKHPIEPVAHITLLRMLGTTHIRVSEYAAALQACERAREIAVRRDLPEQVAVCDSALATCAGFLGDLDRCLALHERVLASVPEENLPLRERAYLGSGAVYWGQGDPVRAETCYRRAAEVSVRLHGGEPDTLILCNLGRVALDQGRFDEAMTRLGEAMRISRRVHDEFGLAIALSLTSRYHWLRDNLDAAIATGHEALVQYRECDFFHFSLVALFQHALVLTARQEWEAATSLLAATQGMGRGARAPDEHDFRIAQATLRDHLPPATFERAWAKGLTMNVEEAFRLALRFR